nr:MAG TPA: hypothetical protein [Bacteriophage sp.]
MKLRYTIHENITGNVLLASEYANIRHGLCLIR